MLANQKTIIEKEKSQYKSFCRGEAAQAQRVQSADLARIIV